MAFLTPCETCRRHVLSTESSCPFCGASVTSAMRARLPRAPAERLGRAAMMLLGATVATTACGSGDESRDTGQPASSSSQTTNGNGTTMPNGSTTGSMMAMPSDPSGPSGTPTTIAEPEPFAVAAYGVAILEPEGSGGAPSFDPPPGGQGGTGADSGPVMEPEPTFMALYGGPVVEPERVEPEPEADVEVDADAGAAEPEPLLEPEPMAVALYGVSPLPADRDRP